MGFRAGKIWKFLVAFGFTLVELMVVVVIIGILVAIAVPAYTGVQGNANLGATKATLKVLEGGVVQAMATYNIPQTSVTEAQVLDMVGFTVMPANSPKGVTYALDASTKVPTATIPTDIPWPKGLSTGARTLANIDTPVTP